MALYLRGVREFGLNHAEAYQLDLRATIEYLGDSPRAARERVQYRRPVRVYPYKAHVIVYVIEDKDIQIVRILHGRQDLPEHI